MKKIMYNKDQYDEKGNGAHYNTNRIDDMTLLEHAYGTEALMNFCEINAMKYRVRAGKKKSQPLEQEILKAEWYERAAKYYHQKLLDLDHVAGVQPNKSYPWNK